MLVFGNPFEILEFIEKGGKLTDLNIGGMSFRKDRKKLSTAVYVSSEELEILKKIAAKNIRLEIRLLPTDRSTNFLKNN